MDMLDPTLLRAEYGNCPQDDWHMDSCTKAFLINDVLKQQAQTPGKHEQLEERFASAPRECQKVLKHFWDGVAKVTNANHTELLGIWRQLLANVALLVSGKDWLALLAWGAATAWLRREGPVSWHDIDEFMHLVHVAKKALNRSSFNRSTKVAEHKKVQNLPFHDVVHGPSRITWWGKGFHTGFYEQMHDLILKRYRLRCVCIWCFVLWRGGGGMPTHHRYIKCVGFGPTCLAQVARAHERTYAQPARGLEGPAAAPLPPVPDVDLAADVDTHLDANKAKVLFPKQRSRKLRLVAEFPGMDTAIQEWLAREWLDASCPVPPVPVAVECMNYLQIRDGEGLMTIHASMKFYQHEWHDSVLENAGHMCRCQLAFLFPLPAEYHGPLVGSAVKLGPRIGRQVPLLLALSMRPFWPFDDPQPTEVLDVGGPARLPAYLGADMRKCGRFLHQHTMVKAWLPHRGEQPEVVQWDEVEHKVHLEQGFFTAASREADFWWDFEFGFW